jgi:hypothetical protein
MLSTIHAHVDLRANDTCKGRRLQYFTLGWNLTEAVVGIGAGVIAGSIALHWLGVSRKRLYFPVHFLTSFHRTDNVVSERSSSVNAEVSIRILRRLKLHAEGCQFGDQNS